MKHYNNCRVVSIFFAFASLLHSDIKELGAIIERLAKSVRHEGIVYMWLKEADHYQEHVKRDEFGERTFYYYSVDDILHLSEKYFVSVAEVHKVIGRTRWFELALRRK